jgi:hypothetical protein
VKSNEKEKNNSGLELGGKERSSCSSIKVWRPSLSMTHGIGAVPSWLSICLTDVICRILFNIRQ